jgi:RimJ/RimL family protein N-acetyltransferase
VNNIITDQNPAFIKYAARVLKVDGFGPCKTLAVSDGESITAVIVYSRFDGNQCEASIISIKPTWANKSILAMIFGYPFEQLGCNRISVICREDNEKAIALAERLGFVRETADTGLRGYCTDGANAHVLGMLKHECRWIKHV